MEVMEARERLPKGAKGKTKEENHAWDEAQSAFNKEEVEEVDFLQPYLHLLSPSLIELLRFCETTRARNTFLTREIVLLEKHITDLQDPSAPPTFLLPPKARAVPLSEAFKMQFYGPTFLRRPTVPERRYPANVVVEESLRVWAFSRWRGSTELARGFLRAGFHHLPAGSPPMFNLVEQRPHANAPPVELVVHFTNRFDAYHLLAKVYWCGCEFIAFTTYNIFTDFESIFPARDRMHSLLYHLSDNNLEEEEY
ncbi:Auxin-induced protein 5NG4 [Hordeum vulgare]|nr:Auxin-induced protein 5NG4 [Hordeum vulgare]